MLSPKKQPSNCSAHTANWDSIVLLSLIEIADKVISDSRVQEGERPNWDRAGHDKTCR
jgi:hypothetical protein